VISGYEWLFLDCPLSLAVALVLRDSMMWKESVLKGPGSGRFPSQHGFFPGGAPVVTADSSRLADDAMARNQKGDGILPHGSPHRARCSRAANPCGEILIGHHRTHGNLQQSFPHLELKVGSL